jgi:hypothetical protein
LHGERRLGERELVEVRRATTAVCRMFRGLPLSSVFPSRASAYSRSMKSS